MLSSMRRLSSVAAKAASTANAHLFSPFKLRSVTLPNRIGLPPMDMFCAVEGKPTDFHFTHYTTRAIGGNGLIILEVSSVSPEGRITPGDVGIWSDEHGAALAPIAAAIAKYGAVPGIQIGHAGRKGSFYNPVIARDVSIPIGEGGWECVAPSAVAFWEKTAVPRALETSELPGIVESFVAAARRAVAAGFQLVEVHSAHGYLLHEFLSPLSNQRTDDYGGSFENRTRLVREVVSAVRAEVPAKLPLAVRISVSDFAEGGWDEVQSVQLAKELKKLGVDIVDCSGGGLVMTDYSQAKPGWMVPMATRVKQEADIPVAAVGLITKAEHADSIVREAKADLVFLGRAQLYDPFWALHAAGDLNLPQKWPGSYAMPGVIRFPTKKAPPKPKKTGFY